MNFRLKKAIEAFVAASGPESDAAGHVLAFEKAANELSEALEERPLEPSDLDRLCAAVDQDVRSGMLDARSRTADARLDAGGPFSSEEVAEIAADPRAGVRRRREDARFLRDSGLLGEVNRRVLHPLGAALAVEVDGRTGEPIRISPRLVRPDDPAGIVFADGPDEHLRRYRRFMRESGFQRIVERTRTHGFRVQPAEGVDPALPDDLDPDELRLAAGARAVLDAARAFSERLKEIHADSEYQKVWTLYQLHDGPYLGPKYEHELSALRNALSRFDGDLPELPTPDPRLVAAAREVVEAFERGEASQVDRLREALEAEPRPLATVTVSGGTLEPRDLERLSEWMSSGPTGAVVVTLPPRADLRVELLGPGAREVAERAEVRVVRLGPPAIELATPAARVVDAAREVLEFVDRTELAGDAVLAPLADALRDALRRFDATEVERAVSTGWGEDPAADAAFAARVREFIDWYEAGGREVLATEAALPSPDAVFARADDPGGSSEDPQIAEVERTAELERAELERLGADPDSGESDERSDLVIHALEAGRALCGAGRPDEWPAGYHWLPTADFGRREDVRRCPGCVDALRARRRQLGQ